jgi:flagellar protein FliS
MAETAYNQYFESEILNADPVKLVTILYRAAIEAAGAARRNLAAGAIRERSRQIMKTWSIIHQLMQSLDRTQESEIRRGLVALYAYMQTRLLEANAKQADPPLEEVQKLLATLLEGWQVNM